MKQISKLLFSSIFLCFTACNVVPSNPSSVDKTKYEIVDSYVSNIATADGIGVSPFNTSIMLRTFCIQDDEMIYPIFNKKIIELHKLFDRYNDYLDENNQKIVNLKAVNESYATGEKLTVDQNLINLLSLSIKLSELTEGYFNPTLGELIDKWNYFEVDGKKYNRFSPYCLEQDDIELTDLNYGLERIIPYDELSSYIIIDDENNTVEFKKYKNIDKITLSLGAIAKGYAVEEGKRLVDTFNVSAMIDGGSSSSYGIGNNPNPNRNYWIGGISTPYKTFPQEPVATIQLNGTYTLSVSGDYESCFFFKDENNKKVIRHHILNPFTGYPENHWRVLSLKSTKNSHILDGLSTALFNIDSTNEILRIIKKIETFYDMEISVLIEKEINHDNKKLDVYLDNDYSDMIMIYNSNYVNDVILLEE